MRLFLVLAIFITLLTGCAGALQIHQLSKIDPNNRSLVLMNPTPWNVKLRLALEEQGFKVMRFASLKMIQTESGNKKVAYNLAEARYGITVDPGPLVDWCVGGSGKKYGDFTLEVTDLKTNQPVLVVEKGGWTNTCMGMYGNLFPDLAKALRKSWK